MHLDPQLDTALGLTARPQPAVPINLLAVVHPETGVVDLFQDGKLIGRLDDAREAGLIGHLAELEQEIAKNELTLGLAGTMLQELTRFVGAGSQSIDLDQPLRDLDRLARRAVDFLASDPSLSAFAAQLAATEHAQDSTGLTDPE